MSWKKLSLKLLLFTNRKAVVNSSKEICSAASIFSRVILSEANLSSLLLREAGICHFRLAIWGSSRRRLLPFRDLWRKYMGSLLVSKNSHMALGCQVRRCPKVSGATFYHIGSILSRHFRTKKRTFSPLLKMPVQLFTSFYYLIPKI